MRSHNNDTLSCFPSLFPSFLFIFAFPTISLWFSLLPPPPLKVCNGDFIANSQRGQLLITVLSDTQIQIDYYFSTFLNLPEPSLRNSVTLTSGNHDYSPSQCATNLYLPFVGNFTDPEYGLFLYISFDPIARLLNGFYSELGVLRGSINAEMGYWEARWVEPGILYDNTTVPTSGYAFFWLLSLDSFTGDFFFDNSLQVPSRA